MASLDNMEGDAIEAVLAIAIIVLIVVILYAYYGLKGWNPLDGLQQLIQKLFNRLKGIHLPDLNSGGSGGDLFTPLGDYLGESDSQLQTGMDYSLWGTQQ